MRANRKYLTKSGLLSPSALVSVLIENCLLQVPIVTHVYLIYYDSVPSVVRVPSRAPEVNLESVVNKTRQSVSVLYGKVVKV
jgi:hypothetical protein